MGTSLGSLAIRTDIENFDSDNFVKAIFGENSISTMYVHRQYGQKVSITKTSDGFIWLGSSKIVDGILQNGETNFIKEIYEYLNKPDLMIALNEYDSGGTYGYGIIKNGELIRRRITLSYDKTIESGNFLELEKEWLEGEQIIGKYDEDNDCFKKSKKKLTPEELEENEDYKICRVNKNTGELISEAELTQFLHKNVMIEYFGYTIWESVDKVEVLETISYYT